MEPRHRGGSGAWIRDGDREHSGPPRGHERNEEWWEKGAREAESVAPGNGVERSGDGTQRKAARATAPRSVQASRLRRRGRLCNELLDEKEEKYVFFSWTMSKSRPG